MAGLARRDRASSRVSARAPLLHDCARSGASRVNVVAVPGEGTSDDHVKRAITWFGLIATAACGSDMPAMNSDFVDAGAQASDAGPAAVSDATGGGVDGTLAGDAGQPTTHSGGDASDGVGPRADDGGPAMSGVEAGGHAGADAGAANDGARAEGSTGTGGSASSGGSSVAGGSASSSSGASSSGGSSGAGGSSSSGAGSSSSGGGTSGSSGGSSTCASALPAGWSLALFNTATDPCPTGFAEHIVSGTPVIGAGACSCTCSVSQQADCSSGMLTGLTNPGHHNDACVNTWPTAGPFAFSGGQCVPIQAADQGTLGNFQATPLPPQGGACSSSAVQANTGQLTEPTQRFCDVPAASADAVCGGSPPAGFSACIVSSGQVSCPAGTPFVHPFTVEDAAALQCSSCTACTISATCSNASVSVFTDAACSTAVSTLAVDGTCVLNMNEVATVTNIKYTATSNTTCAAGSSTASFQLTGARTICCQ